VTLPLLYTRADAVATITLNRPEARNALTAEMLCRFADAVADIVADDTVRVVIVTASGDAAFCAGGDLGTTIPLLLGERAPADAWEHRLLDDPAVLRSSTLRTPALVKPVIAAVNGHCHAAGAELLLGTDIRIAVERATFAWPEVRRGIIPFAGSMVRLPRQVAYSQAMALLLTGEPIDALEALRIGLVNAVVAASDLVPTARRIAATLAANAPLALAAVKRTVEAAAGTTPEQGYLLEDESRRQVFASADAKEGPRAFMEKRQTRFTGR